ncbi:acetate/propionate family kinase [Streptomyces sp. H27-H1]|uniref:acetate/propionate family kinase n=1 Tax=Streptomyces sp. H27-H1 TaxID=2996461 RepID=UPI002271D5FE|nr:acetate/propionate family kinase [Streptomyces sp. H27-H1]MCY0929080.1 acetate/propionate family kinase [Streptomyces sp. H27-H1]
MNGAVMVLDAGSSSLHLAVLDEADQVLARRDLDKPSDDGAGTALEELLGACPPVSACGHRLVHGGPHLRRPAVVDGSVRALLGSVADLAPLHMPPALAALDTARRLLPDIPHIACPDTAFHSGLPQAAHTYALPRAWIQRHGLRRYGFHGLSYAYAARRAAEVLGRPVEDLQLVITHLGGGCSACAVREGRSVDTTMGFTPLEGMAMSSRSGSIDPGMLLWLQTETGYGPQQLQEVLARDSGLLGLSGTSGDTRELVRARASGDTDAGLALEVFTLGVRRGVAHVAASLDRIDALVFTGEIGEDQPEVREAVAGGLAVLGIKGGLSPENPTEPVAVSTPGAAVPVLVVPTGEIQQIARETRACLGR